MVQTKDQLELDCLSVAYEIAAVEGIESVLNPEISDQGKELREQCYAGAWRAFELRCLLPVPEQDDQRIFHVLHLAALAASSDRWADLQRWMMDHEKHLTIPSIADAKWDHRLLFGIFDCWIRLLQLQKKNRDDLNRIREIITGLCMDQSRYEEDFLSAYNGSAEQTMALRLIALYHWAKATEILTVYLLQGTPLKASQKVRKDIYEVRLDEHFKASRKAAALSQDIQLEMILRWLHAAVKRMVARDLS